MNMKKIYNLIFLTACLGIFFTSCKKFDDLETFGDGKAVVLTSSSADVKPPASDSDNVVLTLNWTNPGYATAEGNYKFVIEIAEKGQAFANASQTTVVGAFTRAFTARELNTILAGFGYLYDEPHDMEVRVVSSYKNNNERYFSNVADVKMTAYKGPATSIDATTMNIIGEAALGWDTDVPLNFIGNKKFTGVVELNYGQEFKLRRDAGSWDINWGIADGVAFELGVPMALKLGGANFKTLDGTGRAAYLIEVDINNNTMTVYNVATTMNIIGDGALGWDMDVPMNNDGNGNFSLITNLIGDKEIKFRMVPGSWDVNWGIAEGETFEVGKAFQIAYNGGNLKIPTDGKYRVEINLGANTAKITESKFPEQLYLVGGGVPAGWTPPNSAPFMKLADGVFEIYTPITANGEFKFLQVQDWAGDWGDDGSGGVIQEGESNAKVTDEGFYRINVDFTTGKWTSLKMDWGVIGSASPGGWDDETAMSKLGNYSWTWTGDLTAGEIKFRANHNWDYNFGDNDTNGSLEGGGANIPVAEAGNYTIVMNLEPLGYTYTVIKN